MTILVSKDGLSADVEFELNRIERLLSDLKRIRDSVAPNADDLTSAPVLDYYVVAARPCPCLAGNVTGDPLVRSRRVVTSDLWVMAPELGWARTLSRFYALGRPLGIDGGNQ